MKRLLLGLAVFVGIAFGGPQILSNVSHQLGGPQLLSGEAQAQRRYVCQWYTRRVNRPYCQNYYRTQYYGGRYCQNYYQRRCGYVYGRYVCRRYYVGRRCAYRRQARRVFVGRRCVNRWYVQRFRRCLWTY